MKTVIALGFKGGTGKTTVSLHLGAGLALFHKKRVLLIDYDPQANLSQGLGFSPDSEDTMVPVLKKQKKIQDVIVKTKIPNLFIIRANTYLDQVENSLDLSTDLLSILRFNKALEALKNEFDYCFIDVPPSLGWLCKSATLASNYIIINSIPEPYSVLAMSRLKEYIKGTQEDIDIQFLGVVLSKWNNRSLLSKDSVEALEIDFPGGLFDTKIRTDVSINNAILHGEPVYQTEPDSRAAIDFKQLVDEFILKTEGTQGISNEEESKLARSC